ncbi:phosphopantetheine-binding protein [Burkholderia ubonensis]|uniref:phosphopantetheine-binding protein n=1 Tax=Burkholderia ubonensis TaxID=101571 RepID=UPI000B4E7755|nr:phosphopantetheine-binding protein [Burkholderia ubonensis]
MSVWHQPQREECDDDILGQPAEAAALGHVPRIRALLQTCLFVAPDSLTEDMRIIDDLCADSLDLLDIVGILNEEFGLEIGDYDMVRMKTVGDIDRVIGELLDQRRAGA